MDSSNDHFYVTLPCNSSLKYFPNNSITHFTTKLHRPIRLESIENWEVGLAEFQYPHTWDNIDKSSNFFYIYIPVAEDPDPKTGKIPEKWETCKIPIGFYKYVDKLVDSINKSIKDKMDQGVLQDEHFYLTYDKTTKHIKFHIQSHRALTIKKPLTHMLGFHQDTITMRGDTTAPFQADLHGYHHDLFIYSDVMQFQLVGDVSAPLLRNIITEGEEDETIGKSFQNIHYFPVSRSEFETIEIDIRTDTGLEVPFEKGRTSAVLHFRKKK